MCKIGTHRPVPLPLRIRRKSNTGVLSLCPLHLTEGAWPKCIVFLFFLITVGKGRDARPISPRSRVSWWQSSAPMEGCFLNRNVGRQKQQSGTSGWVPRHLVVPSPAEVQLTTSSHPAASLPHLRAGLPEASGAHTRPEQ